MKKIKILYITYNLGLGGQEKQLFELIKNIEKNKIDIEVLSLSKNVERQYYFMEYKIPFDYCKNEKAFAKIKSILNKYKKFRPDIIHSFDIISNIYTGFLKNFFKVKAIGGFNGSFIKPKILRIGNRILSFSFEKIVCNSFAGYNYLKDNCKIPEKKLMVIENGIDFEIMENPPFKVSSLEEILKREINTPIIGMVGKLDENKDPMVFVKAAEIVHKKMPHVLFCIIGDGIFKQMVEEYLIKNNMTNYFYLIPKRIDAPWLIKYFDICALSSKNEGFPNVILEYMYWEKPCVVTEAGDSGRVVLNNKTGYVVKRGDFESLANALLSLLSSPDLAKSMGKEAKKVLKEKYDIKLYSKNFLNLYLDVLYGSKQKKDTVYQ